MTKATTLAPLPTIFPTVESFIKGTMSEQDARDYCKANPGWQAYALLKIDPETGVKHRGCAVRPIGARVCDGRPASAFTKADIERATTAAVTSKPASVRKVKAPGEVRNGIEAPREGTVGQQIWKMCDDLWSIRKEPFTRMTMEMTAITRGFNLGNVATECSRWRKFHGMQWRP